MKKLFFQLFYFVFKPIIPLFMFAYFVRAISYYFLIIIGLSLLIFGWIENSRFLIILAGITGVFTIALFFFDLKSLSQILSHHLDLKYKILLL